MAADDPTGTGKSEPIIGSYRLVQPLGTGGMSSVFRALHVESGVEVAVKILPRNLAQNRTLLQRFLREAKSAEALEHPSIVAIYDHGVDNGRYYLVLEYVDGGDLHDWVRKHGPMPVDEAVAAIRSAAEGLRFASSRGLIHRDIKPANLLRTAAGTVKLADLGLALQAEVEDERVTRVGTTVGTVDYMSPEQARDSRGTSERSDIYSLGCTFYFLLTGQPPYPGGDVTEKLTRHFTAPPPDPSLLRPEIPGACAATVRKMMAKKPENRFANYAELIAAFDRLSSTVANGPALEETLPAASHDGRRMEPTGGPLAPTGGASPEAEKSPLFALVDDEDESGASRSDRFRPLDLSEATEAPTPIEEHPRLAEVSMAELAALAHDDDPVRSLPRSPRKSKESATKAPARPLQVTRAGRVEVPTVEAFEEELPGEIAPRSGQGMSEEDRTWLKSLVIAGIGLIAAVIAFHQLYRATLTETPEPPPDAREVEPASAKLPPVAP